MDNKEFVMGWRDYHFIQLVDDLMNYADCFIWHDTIVKEYDEHTVFYSKKTGDLSIYDQSKNIVFDARFDENELLILYASSIWRANTALLDVFGCLNNYEDIEEVFVR